MTPKFTTLIIQLVDFARLNVNNTGPLRSTNKLVFRVKLVTALPLTTHLLFVSK